MRAIALSDIISQIPNILQYFVPGYIGVFCFQFAASKKYTRESQLIASCVFSFLLMSLCALVAQSNSRIELFQSVFFQVFVSSAASAIISLVGALFVKMQWFCAMCCKLFGVSPRTNVLETALDSPKGTNIRVFFKGDKKFHIYGHYAGHDTNNSDDWLYITEPCVCKDDGSEQDMDADVGYLCRLSDVDHMFVERSGT